MEIRAWDTEPNFPKRSRVEKTSRLIYLNKTCFNGLYRVNLSGQFNVPFGKYKNPTICDAANLRACSNALKSVDIQIADYDQLLNKIESRSFVYIDPPYEPISKTASFSSYTADRFDEVDQVRLFKFCQQLSRKRVRFMLSNSSATWLGNLYRKDPRFLVGRVQANRSINRDKHGRGPVWEIVVRNYR